MLDGIANLLYPAKPLWLRIYVKSTLFNIKQITLNITYKMP
jgi:hypothetical protein